MSIKPHIVKCSNCGWYQRVNEVVRSCSKCGKVFIELMDIMSEKEIKERASTHRTGDGVDRLDG